MARESRGLRVVKWMSALLGTVGWVVESSGADMAGGWRVSSMWGGCRVGDVELGGLR